MVMVWGVWICVRMLLGLTLSAWLAWQNTIMRTFRYSIQNFLNKFSMLIIYIITYLTIKQNFLAPKLNYKCGYNVPFSEGTKLIFWCTILNLYSSTVKTKQEKTTKLKFFYWLGILSIIPTGCYGVVIWFEIVRTGLETHILLME